MEISNLSDKELKSTVMKTLIELSKRIEEHSEDVNNKLENIKKNQLQLKE